MRPACAARGHRDLLPQWRRVQQLVRAAPGDPGGPRARLRRARLGAARRAARPPDRAAPRRARSRRGAVRDPSSPPLRSVAPRWCCRLSRSSAPTLFAAALAVGALNGALDIAMNAQGVAVERALGHRIFNSLHAAFSFGALAGAGLGAIAAAAGVSPLAHLTVVAIVGRGRSLGAGATAAPRPRRSRGARVSRGPPAASRRWA